MHACSRQLGPLARVLDAGRQLAHAAPVSQPFARVGEAGPLGGAPVPARRTARVARLGPVLRDLGGALVEVAARLLERLRHRGVHARRAARAAASAAATSCVSGCLKEYSTSG